MTTFSSNNRDLFIRTIEKQLIGPGADIFGYKPETELISSSPRHSYYAGILFSPSFSSNSNQNPADEDGKEEGDNDTLVPEGQDQENDFIEVETESSRKELNQRSVSNIYFSNFPTYCGLTFCIEKEVEKIKVEITYGKYDLAKTRKIKVTKEEYKLINEKILEVEKKPGLVEKFGENFLSTKMIFENEEIVITQPLPVYIFEENGSPKRRTLVQTDFKKILTEMFGSNQLELQKLLRLLGNIYERKPYSVEKEIDLKTAEGYLVENELKYYLKREVKNNKAFIKFQARNIINNESKRYQDCLFQFKIKVKNVNLLPFHDSIISAIDEDFNVIEYQYRNEKNFGKGSNCAVTWEKPENPTWIETTHLPKVDIRSFSNITRPKDENTDVLNLHNLSIWSNWDDALYFEKLNIFVESYNKWINDNQTTKIENEPTEQKQIGQSLIEKQKETYERLISNINYLKNNNEALLCFKLANTAMLLQMVVARDENFEKNRWVKDIKENEFNQFSDIGFFKDYAKNFPKDQPKYRPFQLAFLLMNIESTFNQESIHRTNIVDLIWFPTGGGKTEAYLALTALTIIKRRVHNIDDNTTAVLMRYTLRLLTSQQFERATYLICALEFLRKKQVELNLNNLNLGNNKITIGMWVGGSTTPNKFAELNQYYYNSFFEDPTEGKNRFPITYCPWCGAKLTPDNKDSNNFGYIKDENGQKLNLICHNTNCFFHGQDQNILPVAFIDDQLYVSPPTLLFATVDKLVRLSHKNEAGNFFNQENPPELIIQDELHLLTGPLGSLTGLYETLIDILCTTKNYKPKIIASTATTRNTRSIIKMMYGRELNVFPPQGVSYDDNYFSYVEKDSRRKHIGLIPAGKSSVTTEIKLVEAIYLAKARLLQKFVGTDDILGKLLNAKDDLKKNIDPYWTLVLYYNSLRDLGRSNSRVTQEFKEYIRGRYNSFGLNSNFEFIHSNIFSRSVEFTSRQDSTKIKALLSRTAKPVNFMVNDKGNVSEDNDCIDLALASNMFSVGIDVDRLNLMMVMGQPNSVSEYIQATSRVARSSEGLVVNLFSTIRAREMSFFENFTGFHAAYYKYVEPLSITPFTEVAVDKLLNAVLVGYVRQKLGKNARQFISQDADELYGHISNRIINEQQKEYLKIKLDDLANKWIQLAGNDNFKYNELLKNPNFELMNSLRDIDPDLYIQNNNLDYDPNY